MTTNPPDRLDRIEALVESNARAIQALGERLSEINEDAAQERHELRQATLGIANLLSRLDEDRPTILRQLNSIEGKVDRLLDQGERS
jgi:chromosome segregation ATPase